METGDILLLDFTRYHLDDVAAMEEACFSDPWTYDMLADELNNPLAHYFVALRDGKCVGYGGGIFVCGEFEITTLAVDASCRRLGIGRKVLEKLIAAASALGAEMMHLEVRASNAPAIGLYTGCGFEPVGRRKNYYEKPREDALLMSRRMEKRDGEQ